MQAKRLAPAAEEIDDTVVVTIVGDLERFVDKRPVQANGIVGLDASDAWSLTMQRGTTYGIHAISDRA